jgi:long-chain acyl-CoA synthetase
VSDPLALLPLALAAGGGRVDEFEAQQLVAAGLTLLQRSVPLVRALSGRRSAILLPTSPAFLTALAASEGRAAVLINPLAATAEIAFQIRDANVGAVFTDSSFASRLPDGVAVVLLDDSPRTARVVAGGTSSDIDLGAHHGLDLSGDTETPGRDEEAAIVYTSAMAGTPLGAILTHRNLLHNARATVEAAGNVTDDHVLALLPLAHLFGLTVTFGAPLLGGGRITTVARFNPARAIDVIESTGITEVVGVPAVFHALLGAIARRGRGWSSERLRLCICGGAVLATELQDRWFDATGVELRQGYGLTEAGPVSLFNRVDLLNRRGTLGVPFPGIDVEIQDPRSGSRVLPGSEGEIAVRGDSISPGYVTNGERGLERRDGWLLTGDLGVENRDGTFTFRGLRKSMFTRNGFNIYPAEIEQCVGGMPGVRSARIEAIPVEARENDIRLLIVGTVSSEAVKEWCEGRLSAYKQPSEITVTPA